MEKKWWLVIGVLAVLVLVVIGFNSGDEVSQSPNFRSNEQLKSESLFAKENQVFARNDEKYRVCQGDNCVEVFGNGTDECQTDDDCSINLTYHNVCSGGECVVVSGPGASECIMDADCFGNETNSTGCDYDGICEPGQGEDEFNCVDCAVGNETNATHMGCVGDYCVVVPGPGADMCASDLECNGTNGSSQGFCLDNEPFLYEGPGGVMLTPSSCAEYNLVYPGYPHASMRQQLCVNDCVPGASDPANNGHGGEPLIDWGCAWDASAPEGGQCYFAYTLSNGTNGTIECDFDGICEPWQGEDEFNCVDCVTNGTNGTCYDTDGGFNVGVWGSCTDEGGTMNDGCIVGGIHDGWLREITCENGQCTMNDYECPYGCSDGVCLSGNTTNVTCYDSDGGRNWYQVGTTEEYTVLLGQELTDFCWNYDDDGSGDWGLCSGPASEGCQLVEHSCKSTWDPSYGWAMKEKHNCDVNEICSNGACVPFYRACVVGNGTNSTCEMFPGIGNSTCSIDSDCRLAAKPVEKIGIFARILRFFGFR